MQFSSWKSTIPLLYCTIAPGDGHAFRQPGSSQCMQPSLRISHSRSRAGFSYSENRMTVHECSVRSAGLSYTPTLMPTSSRRSFHSRHAVWHALQPMHFDTSISLATSVCRCAGGVIEEAERRIRSLSPNFGGTAWVVGFGIAGNMVHLPLCHRPGDGLDIDQEGLELRRLRVGVADRRRQHVDRGCLLALADEAEVERHADLMDGLAVDLERHEPLGDHGLAFDLAAV